jgi:hypothetical protein
MSEVDRFLALEDAVLRHKVIRQPDHVAGRAAAKPRRRPAPRGEAPRAGTSTANAPAPSPAAAVPAAPVGAVADSEVEGGAEQAPIAAAAAESAGTDAAAPSGDAAPPAS